MIQVETIHFEATDRSCCWLCSKGHARQDSMEKVRAFHPCHVRVRDTVRVDWISHHTQKLKNSSRCVSSQMKRLMASLFWGDIAKPCQPSGAVFLSKGNTRDFRASFMFGYLGKLLGIIRSRAGEIARLLRALANLPECPGLIPSTNMAVTWL